MIFLTLNLFAGWENQKWFGKFSIKCICWSLLKPILQCRFRLTCNTPEYALFIFLSLPWRFLELRIMSSFAEQKLWFQEFSSITVVNWLLTCSVGRDFWTWPYPIRLKKISFYASVKYSRPKLDFLVKIFCP